MLISGRMLDRILRPYEAELERLHQIIATRDARIAELQQIVLRSCGLIRDTVSLERSEEIKPVVTRNTWRSQRSLLEEKFRTRPPELEEREKHWKMKAEEASKELEEDASKVS